MGLRTRLAQGIVVTGLLASIATAACGDKQETSFPALTARQNREAVSQLPPQSIDFLVHTYFAKPTDIYGSQSMKDYDRITSRVRGSAQVINANVGKAVKLNEQTVLVVDNKYLLIPRGSGLQIGNCKVPCLDMAIFLPGAPNELDIATPSTAVSHQVPGTYTDNIQVGSQIVATVTYSLKGNRRATTFTLLGFE